MQPRIPPSDSEQLLAALPAFPTMYDLPSEDPEEPGLPDEFHGLQPQLLSLTLQLPDYSSEQFYTAFDLNLYYDLTHPLWHKRPDWFLVVGVPRLYEGNVGRDSYVLWQEKVSPIVIVELLSPGTEVDDLGPFAPNISQRRRTKAATTTPPSKFEVYESILKVPHYIVFNKRGNQLRYFRLVNGRYAEQSLLPCNPRLWIAELGVGLALWQGVFRGMPQAWLRWCHANGELIPTDAEAAQQEAEAARQRALEAQQQRDRAEAERQQAEAERQQAEVQRQQAVAQQQQAEVQRQQAVAQQKQAEAERQQAEAQVRQTVLNLLALGMPTAQVAQITGLSIAAVEAIALASQSDP